MPTAPQRQPGRDDPLPDSMQLYLRDIGRVPLLTAAQEVALAQRVEQGDAEAARALAAANLRLVVSVARRFTNRGVPLEDIIAEGNMGLLRAVQKYDWRLGYRFSTYASWWIRQAIVRGLANTGHTIRLPVYVQETLRQQDAAVQALASTLEREPTAAEIAAHLGPQSERSALAVGQGMTGALFSLDQVIEGESEMTLADVIPDQAQLSPDERLAQRLLSTQMHEVLCAVLSEREREVIALRFGLEGSDRQTLGEIGKHIGLTRERVRQIEARALGKLRIVLQDSDLRSA